MQRLSFYHGIYFPRRLEERFQQGVFFDGCGVDAIARWRRRHVMFLEKLALLQPGRRLLIKNPVYSARIALLREIWPEAQFIHIYRNPFRVFASTRSFYAKLLGEFALQRFEHAHLRDRKSRDSTIANLVEPCMLKHAAINLEML
jgi:hypothetical protein